MTPSAPLARLMAWLSPVFPTGGFAYSAGLESAAREGRVADEAGLAAWLSTLLAQGSLWNDLVLLACAHRQDNRLPELGELAAALAPSAGRQRETLDQGAAFLEAAGAWGPHGLPAGLPLPVAVGALCRKAGIELDDAVIAYGQTVISGQCQAAIRLSITGQAGAARIMAALEASLVATAARAATATLDDLGGCAFHADIMSARHEALQPRIFLS